MINNLQKTYKFWYLTAFVLSSILLLPVIFLFLNNLGIESNIWQHIYRNLLLEYVSNTIFLIIPVCVLSVIISFYSAYIITFSKLRFKHVFDVLLMIPLAIPSYIMTYTYSNFFSYSGSFHLIKRTLGIENYLNFSFFSFWVMVLMITFSLFPYLYISYRAYFSSMPNSILYNVKSLAIPKFQSIYKIFFPLSRPAMVAGLFLIVMEILNDYGAVAYFGYKTFTLGIFRVWLGMNSLPSALNLSFYLIMFVIMLIFLEKALKGGKIYKMKRDNSEQVTLNKMSISKYVILLFIIFFTFLLPFSLLIRNTLMISDFTYFKNIFETLTNTLLISIFASFIILIFSISFHFNSDYNSSKFLSSIIKVATAGYSIPGAVIALACLTFFSYLTTLFGSNVLNSGIIILIFALVIRFIAVSYNALNSGSESLGKIYINSCRSFGKSTFSNLFKVYLPMQKNFIVSSVILVFVDISKELPLTLILRPFNFDTLATRTFDFAGDEMIIEASFPALIIVIIGILSIIFFKKLNK